MANIKEEAQAYEPKQTRNVAELPHITTDMDLKDGQGTTKDGDQTKVFNYKYIEYEGEEYRVPGVVIGQIKAQLEANPNLKKFKVKKSGTGLGTSYTVIPLG